MLRTDAHPHPQHHLRTYAHSRAMARLCLLARPWSGVLCSSRALRLSLRARVLVVSVWLRFGPRPPPPHCRASSWLCAFCHFLAWRAASGGGARWPLLPRARAASVAPVHLCPRARVPSRSLSAGCGVCGSRQLLSSGVFLSARFAGFAPRPPGAPLGGPVGRLVASRCWCSVPRRQNPRNKDGAGFGWDGKGRFAPDVLRDAIIIGANLRVSDAPIPRCLL